MDALDWDAIWTVRDVLTLLICLAGMGAGIYAMVRKRTLPGLLCLAGFGLTALEPLLDIVLWRIVIDQPGASWDTVELIYMVLSTPAMLLGGLLLAVAFFLAVRPASSPRPPA